MSSPRLHGGLMMLWLLMGCRLGIAASPASPGAPNPSLTPIANPATVGATNLSSPDTPSVAALPANTSSSVPDASNARKFYTLTASIREIYDDNVNTANSNPQASFETEVSPSVLVDYKNDANDFSARYTFDMTYYESANSRANANNGGGASSTDTLQYSHEFLAQYLHTFNDRFSLAVAEDFRYFVQPSLFESVGTNYQNGPYTSNIISGNFIAQWTPLFGTTTTYSNTLIKYENSTVAFDQNSDENIGSQNFSFAILPKISANFGGIVDDITYDSDIRGYTNYTGFVGGTWQILPSMTFSARGGGSYTETVQSTQPAMISPYADVSFVWNIGAKSGLSFDYSHEVTPSDQAQTNGESSDRLSANFRYDVTTRISAHLQGTLTQADISQDLLTSNSTITSYNETDYAVDTGLSYHYDKYLDFDAGIIVSGVSSELNQYTYHRNEGYLGVRGTY